MTRTYQSLKDRLNELISNDKSGIVAFCAEKGTSPNEESFWKGFKSISYISSMKGVAVNWGWGYVSYYWLNYDNIHDPMMEEDFRSLSSEDNHLPLDRLGFKEDDFIGDVINNYLWEEVFNDVECMNEDPKDIDEALKSYRPKEKIDGIEWQNFRIAGGAGIEEDMLNFTKLVNNRDRFSCCGTAFRIGVETIYDGYYDHEEHVLALYMESKPENSSNPDHLRVLCSHDLAAFYAKSKTFIFLNFHKGRTGRNA